MNVDKDMSVRPTDDIVNMKMAIIQTIMDINEIELIEKVAAFIDVIMDEQMQTIINTDEPMETEVSSIEDHAANVIKRAMISNRNRICINAIKRTLAGISKEMLVAVHCIYAHTKHPRQTVVINKFDTIDDAKRYIRQNMYYIDADVLHREHFDEVAMVLMNAQETGPCTRTKLTKIVMQNLTIEEWQWFLYNLEEACGCYIQYEHPNYPTEL